jgi:hypothetical protein
MTRARGEFSKHPVPSWGNAEWQAAEDAGVPYPVNGTAAKEKGGNLIVAIERSNHKARSKIIRLQVGEFQGLPISGPRGSAIA